MKLTLDAIEALDAIAQHGSFAAAAKSVHKAQSAVSYAIKQLEESLGVQLFDRAGHRAILTPAGRSILEEGRQLLAQAKRIESLAERLHETWETRIELVIDGILPMTPIMRALKRMADDAVPTQIQMKVEFLGGVHDRFVRDDADIMLVKDYARSSALVEHKLPSVPCVLVAAKEHPLASPTAAAHPLAELQSHVELTVHDSSESRRRVDARMFGCPRVFYLSDFQTKKQALGMGLGFGWMPRYLVEQELDRGDLIEVAYEGGSSYEFVPVLVHPKKRPLGRAGAMLLSMLTS